MMHIWGLIMCAGLTLPCLAQETVRITVGEWPPYVSEDAPDYGLASKITTEAFDAVGIRTEYIFYPWKRAYVNAGNGDADATLLWVKTPEREQEFIFSNVVITGTAAFFHLKSVPFDWKTLDDLKRYRIGGLRSAVYPWFEEAKNEGIPLTMELVNDEEANFNKLLSGHIDIFSLDVFAAYSMMNKYLTPEEKAQITYNPTVIESWDYCLLVSKKITGNLRIVSRFNEGLQTLRDTGRYDGIIAEYQNGKLAAP